MLSASNILTKFDLQLSMNHKSIKVSIITVVYNGELLLEGTIKSIIDQSYDNIEFIVIDGASTDGTLSIIKKYESHIDFWMSEKDNGLYDAMNKGIQKSTGDYIWFMNSGDHIHRPDTVEKMIAQNEAYADILYGEVMMVDDDRKELGTRSQLTTQKLPKDLTWKSLKYGMVVSHQAFLPKRTLVPQYMEDNMSADIDWVIECLKKSKTRLNTNLILADFLIGGISKQRHKQSLIGRFKILQKHYGMIPNFFNHIYIVIRSIFSKNTN